MVAAHPDDEVLGAGGTMAILAAAGVRLRLVAVTDGEGSHPGSDPVVIGSLRAAESAVAPDLLGVRDADVIRLRLPDTAVAAHEAELAGLLRGLCAGFAVCLAPWDGDAHADHEATGRAARRAARTVPSYPIWMWHWARPADPRVPWSRACRMSTEAESKIQMPLTPDTAARRRRGPETIGHRRLRQPAHRPRGAGPGAATPGWPSAGSTSASSPGT